MIPLDTNGKELKWHKEQRPLWRRLTRAGWKFSRPEMKGGMIGLQMEKSVHELVLYHSATSTAEEIHTWFLEKCIAFAATSKLRGAK